MNTLEVKEAVDKLEMLAEPERQAVLEDQIGVLPVKKRADAIKNIVTAMPESDEKQQLVAGFAPPSQEVANKIWLIIVRTLAVVLLAALGAVIWFVQDGTTTEVVAPLATAVLGAFIGFLAPSPIKSSG